jgi:hypothetical protein
MSHFTDSRFKKEDSPNEAVTFAGKNESRARLKRKVSIEQSSNDKKKGLGYNL